MASETIFKGTLAQYLAAMKLTEAQAISNLETYAKGRTRASKQREDTRAAKEFAKQHPEELAKLKAELAGMKQGVAAGKK